MTKIASTRILYLSPTSKRVNGVDPNSATGWDPACDQTPIQAQAQLSRNSGDNRSDFKKKVTHKARGAQGARESDGHTHECNSHSVANYKTRDLRGRSPSDIRTPISGVPFDTP